MTKKQFYKDFLDTGNDNSDLSDLGPEDLASISKGVDDMDDALFGFKPKQPQTQTKPLTSDEKKTLDRPKSGAISSVLDFPDGDPLADISLSDEDFYDLGKKSLSEKQDTNVHSSPLKTTQGNLTKSKKIADLFGLNDEEDVSDRKRKQESAGDWLGIKDSPIKTVVDNQNKDKPLSTVRRKSVTDNLLEQSQASLDNKIDLLEVKNTPASSFKESEAFNKPFPKQVSEQNKSEFTKSFKTSGEQNIKKPSESIKDKRSLIFDELFGDNQEQKKTSRRNSGVGKPDVEAPAVGDEWPGQYTPSSGASRRPGLGRRREHNLTPTSATTSRFKEDWNIDQPNQQEKKEIPSQIDNAEPKTPVVKSDNVLPTWLGGTGVIPESQNKLVGKSSVEKKLVDKQIEQNLPDKLTENKPKKILTEDPDKEVVDTVQTALLKNSEQNHHTILALQRTEAQLATALELQTTQSSLEAVCSRQRRLLDSQEKQLAQLMAHQATRQAEVEKQMTTQQQRINLLLQALTTNVLPSPGVAFDAINNPIEQTVLIENETSTSNEIERDLQRVNLENEELRLRIKLMEKHYKMEVDSFQLLHRKDIEFWEDQLSKQKELSEQMKEEFQEKINHLKENNAELIAEHNKRVDRLREESAEDMKQLMQIHKSTLEQVVVLGKLVAPLMREEQKSSLESWKPMDNHQISEKEEELLRKERILSVLQEKLENQKQLIETQREEDETKLEEAKTKNEEISRQLKQEQSQLKYKRQIISQEKKHLDEQGHVQRKMLEEMQERVMSEQTDLTLQKLTLAEERAKLEALAKLQGVSGSSSFDIVQSKAEVHGALEAARAAEMQAVEEGRRLKEKERALDDYRWKLCDMEKDLVARAQHLDRLMQISEAKEEASRKALEEAKLLEINAEEKGKEVERRKLELREKEQSLIRLKLDIAQEEIRINKKKEQLEHVLPQLLPEEAWALRPIKEVIDPKMLIMKLRAEREFEAVSKSQQKS